MDSWSRETGLAEILADPIVQVFQQADGFDRVTVHEPTTQAYRSVDVTGDILMFNRIVSFRDADSGRTLAGKIVGRTLEAEPKYDVRVGSKIYADIPAPRIDRAST